MHHVWLARKQWGWWGAALLTMLLLLAACASNASVPLPPTPASTPALPVAADATTPAPTTIVTSTQPTTPATPATPVTPTKPDKDELAALDSAEPLPHDRTMLVRALGDTPDISAVARTEPLEVQVGDTQTFWVMNIATNENVQITAELRYNGPVVLMYVEQGLTIDQETLEATARTFEEQLYPRTRAFFGSEWQPGVDGDPRITVLNVSGQGDSVAGYFSPRDSSPQGVNRFSNEREMFYMKVPPDNSLYLSVLAHEFQHMIHWNEQRRSATWFNEGCATFAQDINGYGNSGQVSRFLATPDTQLTDWSASGTAAHYGAANLFVRYVAAHPASTPGIAPLLRADASNNLDAFADYAGLPHAGVLFGDWAVANLLNDPAVDDGRYAYPDAVRDTDGQEIAVPPLPATVTPDPLEVGETDGTVHQFGADYLRLPPGPLHLDFQGDTSVSLAGTTVQGSAWWSGRGDNTVSTLTRRFDLPNNDTVQLRFSLWYDIETDYDYAFVSVSPDDGARWRTLAGTHTTSSDPQGANYGNGYTGTSMQAGSMQGGWVEETIDLSPYAGTTVLVRFWLVNDEGISETGMLLDNIRLCTSADVCPLVDNVDDVESEQAWQTAGFVRVDGDLPQRWEVRLVRTAADGETVTVERLPTDATSKASVSLAAGEQGVLVVAATTPHTTQQANYTVSVSP